MSGGGTNTVSQQTVPSWLQPYYTEALSRGDQLTSGPGPAYYPGNQVAPLNPLQEQGLDTAQSGVGMAQNAYGIAQEGIPMAANAYGIAQQGVPMAQQAYGVAQQGVPMAQRAYGIAQQGVPMAQQAYGIAQGGVPMAQQGYGEAQRAYQPTDAGVNSIMNAARQPSASSTAQQTNQFMGSGALMDPSNNPYLQQTFQQGANAVQNQLSTEFAGSGRNIIGSLPIQSDEMNNLATQLYGGNYQAGVNATNAANSLAPSIDQGTYMPGNQLLNASSQAINNNAGVIGAGNNILGAGNNLANSGNNVLAAGNNLANSGNNVLAAGNNLANSGNNILSAGNNLMNSGNNYLNTGNNLANAGNNVLNAGNNELNAGAGLQGQTQNMINQNVNAWNYGQQLPYNQLSYLSGLLGSNAAGFHSGSSNTSGTSNPWATAAGVGMLGNSLLPGGYAGLFGGAGTAFAGTGATAASIAAGTAAADAAGVGASAGIGAIAADAAPAAIALA